MDYQERNNTNHIVDDIASKNDETEDKDSDLETENDYSDDSDDSLQNCDKPNSKLK